MKKQTLVVLLVACSILWLAACGPSPEALAAQSATEMASFAATVVPTEMPVESAWSTTGDPNAFSNPDGLAVDAQGNLYVMDSDNNRVQKFDSTGRFISMWGSQGAGDGQFSCTHICMLAVDRQGNVFVTDNDNARVEKFDSSGKFLLKWGSPGAGDGQFNGPFGITTDAKGDVYVGDVGNFRVQKFSGAGKYLLQWGSSGYGDGQFSEDLADIAADSKGNVYVTDRSYGLQKFDSRGTFLARLKSCGDDKQLFSVAGAAVDAQDNLYVFDLLNNRICKLDRYGRFLNRWNGSGSSDGAFSSGGGLAVDAQGNVYAAERYANRVRQFHQP